MDIKTEAANGTAVYRLAGRIDASTSPGLESAVGSGISGGNPRVVYDMRGVTYVSSTGLRGILSAAKRAKAANGGLAIFGLQSAVAEVFEVSGFHNIIPIVPDEFLKPAPGSAAERGRAMHQLTLADEIVVLMLDDNTGAIKPVCAPSANTAIAGGILMELALLGRIDTDLKSLYVVDGKPVGDALLDRALEEIVVAAQTQSSRSWIQHFAFHKGDLTKEVLDRLVQAGILRAENRKFLWVFSRRAYPQNTGREEREAKARLMSVIFDDAVPDPRDTLLLGLADASGVLQAFLSSEEMRKADGRIAQVVALEEIGRSVRAVESDVRAHLAAAAGLRSY